MLMTNGVTSPIRFLGFCQVTLAVEQPGLKLTGYNHVTMWTASHIVHFLRLASSFARESYYGFFVSPNSSVTLG